MRTPVVLALALSLGLDAPAAGTCSNPTMRASSSEDTACGLDVAGLETHDEGSVSVEIGTMDAGSKTDISLLLNGTFLTSLIPSEDVLKMPSCICSPVGRMGWSHVVPELDR